MSNATPSDKAIMAKVTFTKPITLVGQIDYLRNGDGIITHVMLWTEGRDRPTLIPFATCLIEPTTYRRMEGYAPSNGDNPYGV